MKAFTERFKEGMHVRIHEGRAFAGQEAEVVEVMPAYVDIKIIANGLTMRMLPYDLEPIAEGTEKVAA